MTQLDSTSPAGQRPTFFQRHWQKLAAAGFWLAFAIAYAWFLVTRQLTPIQALQQLLGFMRASPWAPLIFIALYAMRPLVLFSATLLTVGGGFVFGPVWGVVWSVVGSNLSATVAYSLGRLFGQGVLAQTQSGGIVQRYAERMRKNSFETIMIMRFVFVPYDLVNYLAGFLRIQWRAFIAASALGSIPGTLSFVLAGASISSFDGGVPRLSPGVLAASAAIFVASLVLSRLMRRRDAVELTP